VSIIGTMIVAIAIATLFPFVAICEDDSNVLDRVDVRISAYNTYRIVFIRPTEK